MQREKFSSRLGFPPISAGCAIGLGNVRRFPYITGMDGTRLGLGKLPGRSKCWQRPEISGLAERLCILWDSPDHYNYLSERLL